MAEREALGKRRWQQHKSHQETAYLTCQQQNHVYKELTLSKDRGPEYGGGCRTGEMGTDGLFGVICGRCIKSCGPLHHNTALLVECSWLFLYYVRITSHDQLEFE